MCNSWCARTEKRLDADLLRHAIQTWRCVSWSSGMLGFSSSYEKISVNTLLTDPSRNTRVWRRQGEDELSIISIRIWPHLEGMHWGRTEEDQALSLVGCQYRSGGLCGADVEALNLTWHEWSLQLGSNPRLAGCVASRGFRLENVILHQRKINVYIN